MPTIDPETIDLEFLQAELWSLPIADVRARWPDFLPDTPLPAKLSRDLLVRAILARVQDQRFGGIDGAARRTLERMAAQLAANGRLAIERETLPRAGTRLVREWKGATHVVEVTETGVMHDGRVFGSLSEVAREITGTRWSGPRFFGLKQPAPSARDR